MMYRISLILALVGLLLIGCASQQYVPKEDEELYGTWINTDYSGREAGLNYQKIVYSPSGEYVVHRFATDAPAYLGTFTIIDKWSDSEGNIWYKFDYDMQRALDGRNVFGYDGNVLAKIGNNGNVFESLIYMSYPPRFPTKLDPNDQAGFYRIYYRQK